MLVGIVGKPSSGKSTFLNAACLTDAKTANYPFTTIEPNMGTSHVRIDCVCDEFGVKDNPKNSYCVNSQRFVPVKLLDVAGLVPDAHKGKGMGNKFLSDLSRADALIHIVDISGSLSANGEDVEEGSRDPLDDVKFLEREINHWFANLIKKKDWSKFTRKLKQEKLSFSDVLYERLAGIKVQKIHIQKTIKNTKLNYDNIQEWTEEDILEFSSRLREISKPILVSGNKIDKKVSKSMFRDLNNRKSLDLIPCSGLAELMLRKYQDQGIIKYIPGDKNFTIVLEEKLSKREIQTLEKIKSEIMDEFGSTGVQNVLNKACIELLNQIVVYPVADAKSLSDKDGNILPDAFLVEKGTKIKDFVRNKIHSDLAKNFIYAINARTNMRISDDYILKNNDVIKIVSAA